MPGASVVNEIEPKRPIFSWARLGIADPWLVVLFAFLLLLPPFPFPIGNSGAHIAPLIALVGLGPAVLQIAEWRRVGNRLLRGLPLRFLTFWIIAAASSAFAARYSGWQIALESLGRVLLLGIGVGVFLRTFTAPLNAHSESQLIARILLGIAAAGAAFACIDFYFQLHPPARFAHQFVWLSSGVMRRAQGVFYESSTLGSFCTFFLVMILAAAFPLKGRRVYSPLLLLPAALVFSVALILSSSRASVVAAATAGFTFVLLHRTNFRTRANFRALLPASLGCIGAVIVVRFAIPAFWANYAYRLVQSARYFWSYPDFVLSGRLGNWKILTDFLRQHPWNLVFGIGYKTIPYTSYIGSRVVADNTWLSLLVETGIVGVAAFAALNVAIFRTTYRAARSHRAETSFFGVWIFCFWCGETVQMLTADAITYWRVLPVYFWVLAIATRRTAD